MCNSLVEESSKQVQSHLKLLLVESAIQLVQFVFIIATSKTAASTSKQELAYSKATPTPAKI
jgi:hypothetical protein